MSSYPFVQRIAVTLIGLFLPILGMAFENLGASDWVVPTLETSTEGVAPTYPWTVWTEFLCLQTNIPGYQDDWSYNSLEEMVQDTIPGEWWPQDNPAYGVLLNNGALKSAAIIIRTRISYHIYNPVRSRHSNDPNNPTQYIYNTTNLAHGEVAPSGCVAAAMNTILPGRASLAGGGSDYGAGNPNPNYQSNLAAQVTAGKVIINDQASVIATEWTESTVERRVAICNDQSRDWGYCALNALADLLPGPEYAQNRRARRLNTTPPGRVEFKAQAYNTTTARYSHYWQLFIDGYMQALPNNGAGYGGGQEYQSKSPDMTFMVPFPQSGSFYVCVRGLGGTPQDDSLHVGIDDNNDGVADATTGLDMMSTWHLGSWQWANLRSDGSGGYTYASIQVSGSEAFHRLRIWMREDGMKVEKVILSTSSSCPP